MLSFVFRIIIGMIFLFAGLAKISDPVRFLLTLREFQLFPETLTPFLAVYLPWLELVLGLSMISGLWHRSSSLILVSLNLFFALAILSVVIRGIDIDCGCFGLLADMLKIPDSADLKAVLRNSIFVGMCLYIFRAKKTAISLENYIENKKRRN